jgi:hypothetical protein
LLNDSQKLIEQLARRWIFDEKVRPWLNQVAALAKAKAQPIRISPKPAFFALAPSSRQGGRFPLAARHGGLASRTADSPNL